MAVLFGQEEGGKRGIINAGHNLYGYKYIKEENRLEVIPNEAEVIRKIFEIYSSGEGMRRLYSTKTRMQKLNLKKIGL
jgi:site-specific DNA recombinase